MMSSHCFIVLSAQCICICQNRYVSLRGSACCFYKTLFRCPSWVSACPTVESSWLSSSSMVLQARAQLNMHTFRKVGWMSLSHAPSSSRTRCLQQGQVVGRVLSCGLQSAEVQMLKAEA